MKKWLPLVLPEVHLSTLSELKQTVNSVYLINQIENPHSDEITDIKISPNNQFIASASKDKTVKMWSSRGRFITQLNHRDSVIKVQFNSDGSKILTGDENGLVHLWSIEGNKSQLINIFEGHTKAITDIRFSPDEKYVATSSEDKDIRIWNSKGQSEGLEGHETEISGIRFSSDGRKLASFAEYETIIIWDIKEFKLLNILSNSYQTVDLEFVLNNRELKVIRRDGAIHSYSIDTGKIVAGYGFACHDYFENYRKSKINSISIFSRRERDS